jgi:hypothetical protein
MKLPHCAGSAEAAPYGFSKIIHFNPWSTRQLFDRSPTIGGLCLLKSDVMLIIISAVYLICVCSYGIQVSIHLINMVGSNKMA